jgi:hypothetical protein
MRGFNKKPGQYKNLWEALMDMDLVLLDGTKCKLRDNIKSVKFLDSKKVIRK